MELTLDGVLKRYGETTALADLSATVGDGEFFTLVGPSGCGKTTTLRLLAGFEEPTAGEVRFGGESMAGVPPEARGVGLVFQSYALFPHMTVAENVGYGLRFAEVPGGASTEERVAELLELVDLPEMGSRDPIELSGGQQQRVALARALAPGPDRQESELAARHPDGRPPGFVCRSRGVDDRPLEDVVLAEELRDEPALGAAVQLPGSADLLEAAVREDGHAVRDGERLRLVVGDVHRRDAEFALYLPDVPAEPLPEAGVKRAHRLVEQQEVGAGENRLTATVVDTEFLGETTRVHLEWEGRRVVVAVEDPPDADEVTVGFDPEDAWVL